MKQIHAWSLCACLALLFVYLHEGTMLRIDRDFAESATELAGLTEVRDLINRRWVEEPQEGQLLNGGLSGMVSTLDPFSDFISTEGLQEFEERTTGKFGGLGIYINVEDGLVVVIAPIEDTPAWEAGVLPGDRILQVDGVDCEFSNTSEAVRALKGEVGTTVTLVVLHEDADRPVSIAIERAQIQIRSVKGARLLDPENKIAYLRMTTFNSGTVDEFEVAAQGLNDQGMRGLILDLRGNPGGFLAAATQVADAFLNKGQVIVKTRGRSGGFRETKASTGQRVSVPVAILINRGSASASEILAGALADHERGVLVGTRSYGKGSVQSIIPVLAGRAELKLTTQYYFTPSGRRIHRGEKPEEDMSWGLVPDVEVKIERHLLNDLLRRQSDEEIARLKALANKEPYDVKERLHIDDPQVKAAYRSLLEALGDPLPAPVEAAGTDVADSGDATPAPKDATPAPTDAPPAPDDATSAPNDEAPAPDDESTDSGD